MYKSKLDLYAHLGSPSGLSIAICLISSTLILFGVASNVLGASSPFYRLLLGDSASGDLVASTRQSFSQAITIFDNPILNNVLLLAFWGSIGIATWFLLTNTTSLFGEVGEDLREVSFDGQRLQHEKSPLVQTIGKVFYHIAIFAVIIAYLYLLRVFLINRVGAYFIAALGVRITFLGSLMMLLAIGLLAVALHFLVVLLRILFLKPRLLG